MSEGEGSRKGRKTESPGTRVKKQESRIKNQEVGSPMLRQPRHDTEDSPYAEHSGQVETEKPATHNIQPSTEEMEVHHHPRLDHSPKPGKEYILEGLMIFLAVTMGFFAESLREHISDSNKEQEYMISLTRDLKHDIAALDGLLKYKSKKIELADSMLNAFEATDYKSNTANLYYWGRLLSQRIFFEPNNGTVQQLNNAGGLRLIHQEIVLDSLQSYINHVKNLTQIQDLEESQLMDYRRSMSLVFDASEMNKMFISKTDLTIKKLNYNPPLNSYDKKDINELKMRALTVKGGRLAELSYMTQLRIDARTLSDMVKKQYELADE